MIDFNTVLENEKKRSDSDGIRKLYMYPEGTFIRAFDWSAWLWCHYIKSFKPMRRKVKETGEIIIQIGCPLDKFPVYIPDGAPQEHNPDGSVFFSLDDSKIPFDADIAAMSAEFEEWKKNVPENDSGVRRKPENSGVPAKYFEPRQPLTITGVMQQILAFPIEKKSLVECTAFLSDLKIQLAKLI